MQAEKVLAPPSYHEGNRVALRVAEPRLNRAVKESEISAILIDGRC
jgi:hypothetical protein